MDTDKNGPNVVFCEARPVTDWEPVFLALKPFGICVHLCSSVVEKVFKKKETNMNITQNSSTPPDSEFHRLQSRWPDLSPAGRAEWFTAFLSGTDKAAPDIPPELAAKLQIDLADSSQLKRIRGWLAEQDEREHAAERAAADLSEMQRQGLDDAQAAAELLKRMKARALATGDTELAGEAVTLDLRRQEYALRERRQALSERKAAAIERAQAELEAARNSKAGLSPETIAKIERELNLL
jgi:hypothetical protein